MVAATRQTENEVALDAQRRRTDVLTGVLAMISGAMWLSFLYPPLGSRMFMFAAVLALAECWHHDRVAAEFGESVTRRCTPQLPTLSSDDCSTLSASLIALIRFSTVFLELWSIRPRLSRGRRAARVRHYFVG
jgi:hypothetical protein